MINEETKKLAQTVVGLYRVVRIQQELLTDTIVTANALRAMVCAVPQQEQVWDAAYQEVKASRTGKALAASLKLIDVTIASLQRDYGPWDN
jgi:hypothetical protein